jgi:hypothetical protein
LLGTPKITNLSALSSQITVEWEEVVGATGYELEADGTIVYSGTETLFVHRNISPNSRHTYRVRAVNGSEFSEWSEGSEWSALAVKSTTPKTPANLRATATVHSITLEWDSVSGSSSYDLEVDGKTVGGITGTSYTHQGLNPNTMHVYRVRAANDNGSSEWSGSVEQRTTPELSIHVGKDTMFNFVVVAPKKPDVTKRRIIVTYNPDELEVLDLNAATPEAELAAGPISGTRFTVSEFADGRIVYDINDADKTIVNIIKFMAKTSEYSKVTYTVE